MNYIHKSNGFSIVYVLLALLIITVIGFAGWNIFNKDNDEELGKRDNVAINNSSTAAPDTTEVAKKYAIPEGYVAYKGDGISFAYPKHWEKATSGQLVTTVSDSKAAIYQGCSDEACAVRYNPASGAWSSTNAESGTEIIARSDGGEAYLIPIKGALNCGTSAAMIHSKGTFAQINLNVCTQPTSPDEIKVPANALVYDEVTAELKEVVKSINKL